MGRILVTGANGLIGSHITEYFHSKGISPFCMVRERSDTGFLKMLGADIVYGDVTDLQKLISVFNSGIDFVIHTAAKVGDWGTYEDFRKVNVEGTSNVLKAAYANSINNLIITGSVSCYGEESSSIVKDENYPYSSHYKYFMDKIFPSALNFYRDTKAEANVQAIKFAELNQFNLTILEPAWVYGEREFHSGFYDFIKLVKGGLHFLPGSKKNKFHTIYARDLGKIYYLSYKKELQGVNKILAVAPEAPNQFNLFNLFCEKAGIKIPHRIPKSIIYPPAFLTELMYTISRSKNAPPISRGRVNIFYDNIEYSSEKLKALLDFTPDYSLEESIEKTILWYKENKYL
ncbi:MAG: NAD(P)-dependent oxidoreductase [Ignavibacteriales bacterium]|nr:MAG: NAD(P)-dependent oxidoreductase [Ignavibacteriales bacterium]